MAGHDFHMTPEGRYRVTSLASRDAVITTLGLFKGFAPIGSGDGLVFELVEGPEKGRLRIVPSHMIVSIDVLDPITPKAQPARVESETDRLYG